MKKSFKHMATMAIGLILAVAIVCSHVFTAETSKKKDSVKTEQGTESPSAYFSAATLSLPTAPHVHLTIDTFCLFDLSFESENEDSDVIDTIEPPKLLLTLFRVIISPNAP